jgi:hypothetical protein
VNEKDGSEEDEEMHVDCSLGGGGAKGGCRVELAFQEVQYLDSMVARGRIGACGVAQAVVKEVLCDIFKLLGNLPLRVLGEVVHPSNLRQYAGDVVLHAQCDCAIAFWV